MFIDRSILKAFLLRTLVLLFLILGYSALAFAQEGGGGGGGAGGAGGGGAGGGGGANSGALGTVVPNDGLQTGAFDVREDYRRANKLSIPFGPPTRRNPEGLDEVVKRESIGPATVDHGSPVYSWPVVIPTATSAVPTRRDMGITKNRLHTFGLPVSDTQYQMIHRMNQQIMLEEMFDPERIMWLGACIGTSQIQDASNSFANVVRQQAASAIDYVSCPFSNFTAEKGNRWNRIHDQLFMPMAFLLLLPGAMLAQVRVIVTAGMPIAGKESSPFEGIIRSIVAVFLIPATYLVVNYGVDLNNSITITIDSNYTRIFHSNMYKDALCFMIKAFPLRQAHENRNGLYKDVVSWEGNNNTPAAGLEARSLRVKIEDPCTGQFESDPDRADEQAPFISIGQRFVTNSANVVLAMTWNILCAFQIVFLMYLFLVGPIIAALWVYPNDTLRGALPGWVEGVITLSFWGLFWNTTVLLMACFRGIDDTGSIIASAILFLSVNSVKFAFDFAGLVKEAAGKAAGQANDFAQKMSQDAKPGVAGGAGGHGGGGGGGGHPHSSGPRIHGGGGGGGGGGGAAGLAHSGAGPHAGEAGKHAGGVAGGSIGEMAGAKATGGGDFQVGGTIPLNAEAGQDTGTGTGANTGTGAQDTSASRGLEQASSGSSDSTGSATGSSADSGSVSTDGPIVQAPSSAIPINPPDMNVMSSSSTSSFDSSNTFNSSVAGGAPDGRIGGGDGGTSINQSSANFNSQMSAGDQSISNINQQSMMNQSSQSGQGASAGGSGFDLGLDDKGGQNPFTQDLISELNQSNLSQSESMPDSMTGTTAGGGYNLPQDSAQAGANLPQGFMPIMDNVNSAIGNAGAALMMPGAAAGQGLPVNPEAVSGLTNLAREMTEVGPQLNQMSPQQAQQTMEGWQQKADTLSNQIYSAQQPVNAESYARMTNDIAQAQQGISQFQQSYTASQDGASSGYYNSASYSPPGTTDGSGSTQGYAGQSYGSAQGYQQQSAPDQSYSSGQAAGSYQQQSAPDQAYSSGQAGSYQQQSAPDQSYGAGQGGYQQQSTPDQSYGAGQGGYQQQSTPDQSYGAGQGGYQQQSTPDQAYGAPGYSSSYPQDQSSSYYQQTAPQDPGSAYGQQQPYQQAPDQSYQQAQYQQPQQAPDQSYQQSQYQQQPQQAPDQSYQQAQYQQQPQQAPDQSTAGYSYGLPAPGGGETAPAPQSQEAYNPWGAAPSAPAQESQQHYQDQQQHYQDQAQHYQDQAQHYQDQAQHYQDQAQHYQDQQHSSAPSQSQASAPQQSHQLPPTPAPTLNRSIFEKPQGKPQDKPAAPQQQAPKEKEAPKHAEEPMKFNPLKQKAPPKKKPEDKGPPPPPPKQGS